MRARPCPPYFAYLGIAPPAPTGALAVAPRALLAAGWTLGQLVSRTTRATNPLVFQSYALQFGVPVLGTPYTPTAISGAIPNPYAPT